MPLVARRYRPVVTSREERRAALQALADDVRVRFGDHEAVGAVWVKDRPGRVVVGLRHRGDRADLTAQLQAAYGGRVEVTHSWEEEQ
jgi:hypothetical protein